MVSPFFSTAYITSINHLYCTVKSGILVQNCCAAVDSHRTVSYNTYIRSITVGEIFIIFTIFSMLFSIEFPESPGGLFKREIVILVVNHTENDVVVEIIQETERTWLNGFAVLEPPN